VFGIEHQSPPEMLPLGSPLGAPDAGVSGIDHVVVRTEAPEQVIRFYGEQLGLRLALDRTFPDWGVRLLFFRIGGITIEMAAPAEAVPAPAAEDTFWGLSWRVPDVAAARTRLVEADFDVSEPRVGRKPGTQVCTVRGPTHGVATLLLQPPARDAANAAKDHAAHQ
jgi:catechol 2,3-dioxygenase-like lactoylglutathione lyase family enzyme